MYFLSFKNTEENRAGLIALGFKPFGLNTFAPYLQVSLYNKSLHTTSVAINDSPMVTLDVVAHILLLPTPEAQIEYIYQAKFINETHRDYLIAGIVK